MEAEKHKLRERAGDREQERGTGEGKGKTELNRQMDRLDSASVSPLSTE